jgi:hypothetical protein
LLQFWHFGYFHPLTLFSFSFILQNEKLENRYLDDLPFTFFAFLPYELFRQSAAISKAQANISEMQASLKAFLNDSDLKYMKI